VNTHTHTYTQCTRVICISILLSFLLNLPPLHAQQLNICGTPESTTEEILTARNLISLNVPASSLNTIYEIPVHFYLVNDDNGAPPVDAPLDYIIYEIFEMVEETNTYYDNGMKFYVCDISTNAINSTSLQNEESGVADLYAATHNAEAVNVYIVKRLDEGALGTASVVEQEYAAVALVGVGSAINLAHELGHNFGLQHPDWPRLLYLPDNSCNPNPIWSPNCENCNSCAEMTCPACTGDQIADTPPDPGNEPFTITYNNQEYHYVTCPDPGTNPCIVTENGVPLPYEYNPDRTNMMSNYSFRDHFTPIQLNVLLAMLLSHPNRAFLLDNVLPECSNITQPNVFYVAQKGKVNRVRQTSTGLEFDPMNDVSMNLYKVSATLDCWLYTDNVGEYAITGCTGPYSVDEDFRVGQNLIWNVPGIFEHNNGVSTLDVLFIRRHILATDELERPYRWIAADVSNNALITTQDLAIIQKVILGIGIFEQVPSWRFLPEYMLHPQFMFEPYFENNPFTAMWYSPQGNRNYLASQSPSGKSYLDDITLNLLDPDVSMPANWSFRGIKSGDVNFDAEVSLPMLNEDYGYTFSAAPQSCLESGQTAVVLVKANAPGKIDGYQMGIRFDEGAVQILGYNQGDVSPFSPDNFGAANLNDGELRTMWIDYAGSPIVLNNTTKTLFKLHVKALRQVCDIADYIELDHTIIENLFYDPDLNLKEVSLALEVQAEEIKHKVLSVYPNPTSDAVTFDLELGEAATVNIQLLDSSNASINSSGSYSAGTHSISFASTSTLLNGMLTYRVTIGNELYTGNIVKVN